MAAQKVLQRSMKALIFTSIQLSEMHGAGRVKNWYLIPKKDILAQRPPLTQDVN